MIDKAKLGAVIDSAHGYLDAIDKFYITEYADDIEFELDGIYMIENGKLGDYNINVNGNKPNSGRLLYENNELINGTLQFEDYVALIQGNNIKVKNGHFKFRILSEEEQKNKIDGLYNSGYDEGRLLYRGYNPNNYMWLDENGDRKQQDDELYRIISFENDMTTRVIRNNSIGNSPWDQNTRRNAENTFCTSGNGCNAWGNITNTYINGELLDSYFYYFYDTNGNINKTEEGTVTTDTYLNMELNNRWIITKKLDQYIQLHLFDVGGIWYNQTYNVEEKSLIIEKKEQSINKWKGKIGLASITDFVEASLSSECKSVYSNYTYNKNGTYSCLEKNWLYNNWLDNHSQEWTMTPFSSINYGVWNIDQDGKFNNSSYAITKRDVRPSFFLKKDLVFYGEGTKEHPYIIENFN